VCVIAANPRTIPTASTTSSTGRAVAACARVAAATRQRPGFPAVATAGRPESGISPMAAPPSGFTSGPKPTQRRKSAAVHCRILRGLCDTHVTRNGRCHIARRCRGCPSRRRGALAGYRYRYRYRFDGSCLPDRPPWIGPRRRLRRQLWWCPAVGLPGAAAPPPPGAGSQRVVCGGGRGQCRGRRLRRRCLRMVVSALPRKQQHGRAAHGAGVAEAQQPAPNAPGGTGAGAESGAGARVRKDGISNHWVRGHRGGREVGWKLPNRGMHGGLRLRPPQCHHWAGGPRQCAGVPGCRLSPPTIPSGIPNEDAGGFDGSVGDVLRRGIHSAVRWAGPPGPRPGSSPPSPYTAPTQPQPQPQHAL
jgi:hypothetical protein